MVENANQPQVEQKAKPKSSWVNLVVDYGPLLVFFLSYRYFAPADDNDMMGTVSAVIKGTVAFMVATVIALIISKVRLGRISPMLWLTTILVVGFGSVTVILRDPFYVQIKPTAVYMLFAIVLFVGLMRGKAMLKYLLESAFEGLNEEGWMKLSRNWAWFFTGLAVLNTVLVYTVSFEVWMQAKLWGFTVISFIFTFSQLPMVMKHGMGENSKTELVENPPHD